LCPSGYPSVGSGTRTLDPVCGFWDPLSPDVLARAQNVRPLERAEDLIAPIWESDDELEQFLADLYAARRAARAHNS